MYRILTMLFLSMSLVPVFAQQISGTLTDQQSGEVLAFAVLVNLNTDVNTTTDAFGRFTIAAEEGKDSLKIVLLGYEEKKVLAKTSLNISLKANSMSLNEVFVTGTREETRRAESPMAIATISAQTISDNKPTTIDQVLNQTAGVYMVDLGNEQHTMSIRKPIDYGASYLYLEDGVPIRTSGVFNHNALLEINMTNVSRIEIIRGPASSFYGSEAIGGAVNFITPKPSLRPTAGISVQGNNLGYKRSDLYLSNTFGKKLGIRLAGYYANQRNGFREHSDFDKWALSLSAHYRLTEKTELVWSSAYVDYVADMTGAQDSTDFYGKSYRSVQTFTNRSVDAFRSKLALNHQWNNNSKTSFTMYYRNNSIRQNPSYRVRDDFRPWIPAGNPNLAHGEENNNSFKSYGAILQQKQDFKFLNSSLIAGVSFDYSPNTYRADYIRIRKNNDGVYESFSRTDSVLANYNADLSNTAAYIHGKINPVKGLNLIVALRYDHFLYDFNNRLDSNAFTGIRDGKNTFNRITPKLGLTYDFNKNRGIYANYSQGFVPPQVTELYVGRKNISLLPVYYESYEVGGWMTFFENKLKAELTFYQMEGLNELISVRQDDGSTRLQNAGKTRHKGIEYALHAQPIKDVLIRFSGTYAEHSFVDYKESGTDYSRKLMPQAPNWIANSQITYKPSFFKGFRLSVEWQHVNEYYMNAANTKKYEGYDVFNLRAGYEWKFLEVWLNVLNIADQNYATVANSSQWGQSYSVGNPRNFNLGIAYKFKTKEQ